MFDGWTTSSDGSGTVYTAANLPVATADVNYYAHYNKITNQYTVTFKNYDGTTLQSGKLYYGATPSYDGTPVRPNTPEYSYTFAGWTPSISTVTGEAIYTAYFTETKNKYSVEFRNEDGTTLQAEVLEYGSMPKYAGDTPTKESTDEYDYTFSGWTPEITTVTTQAVYKATYDAVKRKYDVVFKDEDGTVLQNTKWEYGTTPTYSATPTKAATAEYTYTFKGWSPAVVPVSGNADYTAVYDAVKNEYNVYYKNYDGSAITEEAVAYGEAAQMADSLNPTKPAADGKTYVFAGWSADLSSITKNTYAVAQYAVEGAENYWVTFVDPDGSVLYKTIVEEGGTAVYGGEEVTKEGYEFVGWDKALDNITEDTTVTALYSKNGEQYVVTYVDWDDTFIKSMVVNHGESAVAPADPTREGDENTIYTFSGWDNDGTNITSNLVIKATYSVHTHEYNTYVENVIPADCVTNRTDKFSCSCGLTKDIEIADSKDAEKHIGVLTLTGAKTENCTEDGYTGDMVCDACGEVAVPGETITAPGHTKGEVTVENTEGGSCTVPGTYEEVYYCTVCDEEISREKKTGELLPHTPAEAVKENEVAPDCTEDGSYDEVVYCSVCGTEISKENKVDPAKGHTEEEIPAVEATCTETGLTAGVKCSVCGEVLTAQEETPALDHDMGAYVVTTPATCTAEGEERADCSRCDYFETREIEKIAHTE
ncbi:MAG: hypothetical protein E7573_11510, partial [Ruminococcaceae bacterium]|nr:hypothetical protein [Oscillospiraceae bacterium]